MGELKLVKEYAHHIIEDFLMEVSDSVNTKTTYRSAVNDLLLESFGTSIEFATVHQLQQLTVDMFVNYRRKFKMESENKNSSINTSLSGIKGFYKYLNHIKLIDIKMDDINYYRSFHNDSDHYDTIPMYMVEEILNYIQEYERPRLRNQKIWFIKLAVETGLRLQDILNLTKSQFTIEENKSRVIIKSNSKNRGKGNQDWTEVIHINVYNQMKEALYTDSDKLFTMHESTMLKCLQKIIDKLGYEGNFVLHSLKRTAVNNTKEYTGGDITAAQRKAKHKNVRTTIENYFDDSDYGMTGIYSIEQDIQEDYISTATHEELLKALDGMDKSMLLLLQKQIKDNREGR